MATVPNWIPTAVVVSYGDAFAVETAWPIKHWRATNTQVVVQYDTMYGQREDRFRLSNLRIVGSQFRYTDLVPADDPKAVQALRNSALARSVARMRSRAEEIAKLDSAERRDPEKVAAVLMAIRDAANKALAEVGELL